MNVYDFVQALRRQRRFILIGLFILVAGVVGFVFKLDNGLAWRIGPRYEATVRVLVAPVGTTTMSATDFGPGDFRESAAVFAALMESSEAITAVQQENGFKIDEITTLVSEDAPAITLSVIMSTADQAVAAATGLVDWLEVRLQEPIRVFDTSTTTTSTTIVDISSSFGSFVSVTVAPSVVAEFGDLFFDINAGGSAQSFGLRALDSGDALELPMTLSPTMALLVSIQNPQADRLSAARMFVPAPPSFGDRVPALLLTVGAGAIVVNEEGAVVLDATALSVEWVAGETITIVEAPLSRDLTVLVVTEDPVPVPVGQRRGPIILVAALVVGAILLISVAVSRDNWRQLKRAYEMPLEVPSSPLKRLERSEAAEV